MDDNQEMEKELGPQSFIQRHRFLFLIAATIVISIILVSISLYVYKASGAAQLDLSRPGLRSVSSQTINANKDFTDYSDIGPINKTTVTQFKQLYDKQVQAITQVDAFGGDPLNPDTLEFAQTATPQQ